MYNNEGKVVVPTPAKVCPFCGGESKGYLATWIRVVGTLWVFPVGLLLWFVPRFRCKKCKKLFHGTKDEKSGGVAKKSVVANILLVLLALLLLVGTVFLVLNTLRTA